MQYIDSLDGSCAWYRISKALLKSIYLSTSLRSCTTTFFFTNNAAWTMLFESFTMCCMNRPVALYVLIEVFPPKECRDYAGIILRLQWQACCFFWNTLVSSAWDVSISQTVSHVTLWLRLASMLIGSFWPVKLWIPHPFKTSIAIKKLPLLTAKRASWEKDSAKLLTCGLLEGYDPFLQEASYKNSAINIDQADLLHSFIEQLRWPAASGAQEDFRQRHALRQEEC